MKLESSVIYNLVLFGSYNTGFGRLFTVGFIWIKRDG
jgi:hypothetical protein